MIKKRFAFAATLFAAAFMATAPAFAAENGRNGSNTPVTSSPSTMSEARKKACQNREAAANRVMLQYSQTLQNRLRTLDKASERVQNYYTTNSLSSPSYEQLLTQATTQQQNTIQAVNTVREGQTVDCDSSDPIGNIQQFKQRVRAAQTAVKQYRDAVHDLLNSVIDASEEEQ